MKLGQSFTAREGILAIGDGNDLAVNIALKLFARPFRGQSPGFGWLKTLDDRGLYGSKLVATFHNSGGTVDSLIKYLEG